jgi:hypothetical protein
MQINEYLFEKYKLTYKMHQIQETKKRMLIAPSIYSLLFRF